MAEYIKKNDAYTAAGFMAAANADRELTCGEIKQIIDNIPVADVVERKSCNTCQWYEGVHNTPGLAPCSFWNIGGVMWNDFCLRWEGESDG